MIFFRRGVGAHPAMEEENMERYIFGVDLGGTTAKLGLFTGQGELREKWEIPTRTQGGGAHILTDLRDAMDACLTRRGLDCSQVLGAGLGVPGAVLEHRYVKPCVNLDGWGDFDAAQRLSELCAFPVCVVNDANAAALGELWQGGGMGCRNMVFVTLGTGVGGGVIVDGRLLSGVHGCGGELGHMKLFSDETRPCGCGKRGCLEQYASATGIVREAERRLAGWSGETALRGAGPLTAKLVLDCAKAGDPLASEVAAFFGDCLGRALAAVSCVCDPEVFVLGGGVSRAGEYILKLVQPAFVRWAFPPAEETRFCLAVLGNDAGIYGAAKLIADTLH